MTRRIPIGSGSDLTYIEPPATRAYIDRSDATDAEFLARLERLDRLEVADVGAVERVARAMCASDAEHHGTYEWGQCSEELREDHRRVARAAIAALKPPPPDGGDVR